MKPMRRRGYQGRLLVKLGMVEKLGWEDELSNEPRLLAKLKSFSRSICN